jgi:hypothetical protein
VFSRTKCPSVVLHSQVEEEEDDNEKKKHPDASLPPEEKKKAAMPSVKWRQFNLDDDEEPEFSHPPASLKAPIASGATDAPRVKE